MTSGYREPISTARVLAACLLLVGGACGTTAGDQGAPTLSRDVQPIFSSSCAFGNGCHGSPDCAGHVQLGPAGTLTSKALGAELIEVPSFTAPSMMRVAPGDSNQSFLIRKLQGSFSDLACGPPDCGARMPMGGAPLPSSVVDTFRKWIDAGAIAD